MGDGGLSDRCIDSRRHRQVSGLHGDAWAIPVFALETALLLEFAVFWALQTVELWDYADRNILIPDEKQATMAPL